MTHETKAVISPARGSPVKIERVLIPDPGPGEALVRVQACGVCRTDLHYREGAITDDFPFLLGHEAAGVVEQLGAGVEGLSVGDYVLAGGELPALSIVEATVRLLPSVLGDERSAIEESFQGDGDLDHPHYTRPRVFRGEEVPPVLFSGNHASIQKWRNDQARSRTRRTRPDLLD